MTSAHQRASTSSPTASTAVSRSRCCGTRGRIDAVTVSDMRTGEWFVLHVENDQALEAFYHPYAYATLEAAA